MVADGNLYIASDEWSLLILEKWNVAYNIPALYIGCVYISMEQNPNFQLSCKTQYNCMYMYVSFTLSVVSQASSIYIYSILIGIACVVCFIYLQQIYIPVDWNMTEETCCVPCCELPY